MTDINIQETQRQALFRLLAKDRSLYTYQLPEEIVHLVIDYITSTGYIFGVTNHRHVDDTNIESYLPVKLEYDVQDLAFGESHSLLLTTVGQCYISGDNYSNQFGLNDDEIQYLLTEYPNDVYLHETGNYAIVKKFINISKLQQQLLQDEYIIKIAAGGHHSLVLSNKHQCYSFGANSNVQLGIGNSSKSKQWNLIAHDVIDITCGYNNSAYLTSIGQIFVFGSPSYVVRDASPIPIPVSNNSGISNVFMSHENMALIYDNILYVLGINQSNKLGFTDRSYIYPPRMVVDEDNQPLQNVRKVVFGIEHMCILAENQLYVCGSNRSGQLGLGDITYVNQITRHPKFDKHQISDIATSRRSSYVITDKICYDTGVNQDGQLGMGHDKTIKEFTQLPLFTDEFVRSIDSVKVRAAFNSAGLIVI
jgi:alpha-tubulin suppressor-like RCC1 family protein